MKLLASLLLSLCLGSSLAIFFKSSPAWDGLRVTWGINPFSSVYFDDVPRQVSSDMDGFQLKDDLCGSGKFAGKRYWKDSDPAVMLLFDVNGFIAGIQTSVPKDKYTPAAEQQAKNVFEEDGRWTITAYFVDPAKICEGGRTQEDFDTQGTGTGLFIKNGPGVLDNEAIPAEEEAARQSSWTEGKCFWSMGNHFWYSVTEDMSCGKFRPNFLLYNKGKLNAFGFALNVLLDSSRYEHPTPKQAEMFLKPVPKCFYSDPSYAKLSTIHVYFTSNPRLGNRC